MVLTNPSTLLILKEMIKAIIFDFDGVLVESVEVKTRAFAELYKEYGPEIVGKVVEYHLKNGGVSRVKKFRYFHQVLLGKELSTEEERVLGERFSCLVEDLVINSQWVSGAKEFLDMYHNRLDLYVVSGTPDEELERIIKFRNMECYFRAIYGSNKSKGEIVRSILEKNNYTTKEVLMVGDAMSDYIGALEADIGFVGRVLEGHESPFSPKTLLFDNPFQYLHALLNSEIIL